MMEIAEIYVIFSGLSTLAVYLGRPFVTQINILITRLKVCNEHDYENMQNDAFNYINALGILKLGKSSQNSTPCNILWVLNNV